MAAVSLKFGSLCTVTSVTAPSWTRTIVSLSGVIIVQECCRLIEAFDGPDHVTLAVYALERGAVTY